MKIVNTYLVELENGTVAWLAPNKEAEGKVLETRPVLLAEGGKVLKNKTTEMETTSVWLKDTTEADWEEVNPTEEGDK